MEKEENQVFLVETTRFRETSCCCQFSIATVLLFTHLVLLFTMNINKNHLINILLVFDPCQHLIIN